MHILRINSNTLVRFSSRLALRSSSSSSSSKFDSSNCTSSSSRSTTTGFCRCNTPNNAKAPLTPSLSLSSSISGHHTRQLGTLRTTWIRRMASIKLDHAERTATEPRNAALHKTVLAHVDEINPTTRIIRLGIPKSTGTIRFLPGQWLDVFVPGIPDKPGGFTITSPPVKAVHRTSSQPQSQSQSQSPPQSKRLKTSHSTSSSSPPSPPPPSATTTTLTTTPKEGNEGSTTDKDDDAKEKLPYLELAIRKAPENKIAAWLWQPIDEILDAEISVRVGGKFVWPAPGLAPTTLRKIVLIAGGVGINPLISIASHIFSSSGSGSGPGTASSSRGLSLEFLYSMHDPGEGHRVANKMLFVERLADMFGALSPPLPDAAGEDEDAKLTPRLKGHFKLFLTSGTRSPEVSNSNATQSGGGEKIQGTNLSFTPRRITINDISEAIGPDKRFCAVYVCGVPTMTDEFVEKLTSPTGLGLERHRVLSEKWW